MIAVRQPAENPMPAASAVGRCDAQVRIVPMWLAGATRPNRTKGSAMCEDDLATARPRGLAWQEAVSEDQEGPAPAGFASRRPRGGSHGGRGMPHLGVLRTCRSFYIWLRAGNPCDRCRLNTRMRFSRRPSARESPGQEVVRPRSVRDGSHGRLTAPLRGRARPGLMSVGGTPAGSAIA